MQPHSEPRRIQSRHNPQFKKWLRLIESRWIREYQQFLIFGKKVVHETLEYHPNHCRALLYPGRHDPLPHVPTHVTRHSLSSRLFHELDIFGTGFPLLVCQAPPIPKYTLIQRPRGVEVLCPFGEPSNVGAVIRSCRSFGVNQLVLLQEAAHPLHPKSVRAASGTVLDQPMSVGPSLERLGPQETLRTIVALDMEGDPLDTYHWPKDVRILIGEEGQGLPPNVCPHTVAISRQNPSISLNATVAASIALYSYRLQHPFPS